MLVFFNSCFALPECEGGPKEISDYSEVENWSNCKGEITFSKNSGDRVGNHYFGSFENGKLHGQGTYTCKYYNKKYLDTTVYVKVITTYV